jgi:hypothetical protein
MGSRLKYLSILTADFFGVLRRNSEYRVQIRHNDLPVHPYTLLIAVTSDWKKQDCTSISVVETAYLNNSLSMSMKDTL